MVASLREVANSLERQLGMTVEDVVRQKRWRPTWFVKGQRNGAPCDVVVRGDRGDSLGFPLRHEFKFHSILEEAGIPVPRLFGWSEDLNAILMELVPGQPDLANLDPKDRDRVVDEYLRVLVSVHQLSSAPFIAAGITRAEDGSAMVAMRLQEERWRASKDRPEPFMEFCLAWLHRHEPDANGRSSPILCDTGQFLHDGRHLLTLVDLEGGHVGDPMMDLAVWRMRDTLVPFGDMGRLYARYEDLAGAKVDLEAIKRHTFAATVGNELMFGHAVQHPSEGTDLMTYMQWNSETNLMATELLAEILNVDLPVVAAPDTRPSRSQAAFDHVVSTVARLSSRDEFLEHELRIVYRTVRHLARVDEIGEAVRGADLDDIADLLGWRPADWREGDEALEDFILSLNGKDDPSFDAALIQLFYKRNWRIHLQLGPPGSKMVQHYRMQPFN